MLEKTRMNLLDLIGQERTKSTTLEAQVEMKDAEIKMLNDKLSI